MSKQTTIMDTLPARVWEDRIFGPRGWGHGYELVQMFAGQFEGIPGEPGDPTSHASEVIETLLRQKKIRQDKKPSPHPDQQFLGTGGTFNVSGLGAPVVCWRYFRG